MLAAPAPERWSGHRGRGSDRPAWCPSPMPGDTPRKRAGRRTPGRAPHFWQLKASDMEAALEGGLHSSYIVRRESAACQMPPTAVRKRPLGHAQPTAGRLRTPRGYTIQRQTGRKRDSSASTWLLAACSSNRFSASPATRGGYTAHLWKVLARAASDSSRRLNQGGIR